MYTTLTVRDESTSGFGIAEYVFTLDFLRPTLTARDLIVERVRREVEDYNARQPDHFRGLIQPSEAERTLNGFRLAKNRRIDADEQCARALAAFERNGFILLADDHQIERLDDEIYIKPEMAVTFLKLVPLVGG